MFANVAVKAWSKYQSKSPKSSAQINADLPGGVRIQTRLIKVLFTKKLVFIAIKSLKVTATAKENIAHTPVI